MKTTLFISSVLVLFSLFSCNHVYRDFQDVKNLKWYRSDVKKFEFEIKEDGNYDLFFHMRHSTGYPFTSIRTKITLTAPDKSIFEKEAEFPVANEKGEYIGEVAGELWDIENSFSENYVMKKGNYKISVAQAMENDPVILVVDIGLIVKKSH